MKILMMGPQACGKGTQAEKLSAKTGYPVVTVGQLLRDMSEEHPRYKEVHEKMDKGELAPFDLVADLIRERTSMSNAQEGFILDGWARNLQNLDFYNPDFDRVLLISIPREESLRRITGRRICLSDGKTYNIYTMPADELKCVGELVQREDDTEEAVNRRLDIFYTETQKVIDLFKSQGKLIEIDGMGTPDEVFDRIVAALKL